MLRSSVGGNAECSCGELVGFGGKADGAGCLGALQHDEAFAIESLALVVLEALHAGLATVVNACDGGSAFHFEEDLRIGMRTEVSVLVNHFHCDEGKAGAVGGNARLVGGEAEVMRLTCRVDGLAAHFLSVLPCHHAHFAWLKRNAPHHMESVFAFLPCAFRLSVHEQFHFVSLVVVAPKVNSLTFYPVPVRKEMEGWLVGPFALIEIIGVLRETCQVDDAEITAAGRESVRRWFADVVPSRPDVLTRDEVVVLDEVPSFLLQIAPRSTLVVVGRAHESWVGVRSPPFLRRLDDGIGRHHVEATGGERRVAFREDKRFAREVLWHVGYVAIVVVVADDVEGIALEEVIVRIRLVATCRDGACGIELANDVGQTFCQEAVLHIRMLG